MEKNCNLILELEIKNCGYLDILEKLDSEFLDVALTAKKGFETIEGDILDLTAEIFIVEVSLNEFCSNLDLYIEKNFVDYILNQLKKVKNAEILKFNIKNKNQYQGLNEENFELDFGKIKILNNLEKFNKEKLTKSFEELIFVNERMAFGTGRHETTKMCMEALIFIFNAYQKQNIKIVNALDVGCGSGILAIFFAKLFKNKIEAVDIDLDALKVAKDFVDINCVQDFVKVYQSSLFSNIDFNKKYDLIMANILLEPLIEMADHIEKITVKNGILIVSGFLEEQSEKLVVKYGSKNFQIIKQIKENGWVCLVLKYLGNL